MLRPEAQGAQTPLHPGECSSCPCSLGCPAHHLPRSTVLWSLATDRQGRETWGFECLLPSLRRRINAAACVNVTSFPGHALSAPHLFCTRCGDCACSSLGEGFQLEREMNVQVGCGAVQTQWAFVGFPSPEGPPERQGMRTGLES